MIIIVFHTFPCYNTWTKESSTMGQRIGTIKSNNVQLVVWRNGDYFSFQIQKAYRDSRSGEWKKAESVFGDELADVVTVCAKAMEWMKKKNIEIKSLDKQTQRASSTVESILRSIGIREVQ
jgi:hypothetical protein